MFLTSTSVRVYSVLGTGIFGPSEHPPIAGNGTPDRAIANAGWHRNPDIGFLPGGRRVEISIPHDQYYEFRVAARNGFAFIPETVTFDARVSPGGPATFEVRTSIDNFATPLVPRGTSALTSSFRTFTVDFPENECVLATLTVRIHGRGATAQSGAFVVDNLALTGDALINSLCFVGGTATIADDLAIALPGDTTNSSNIGLIGGSLTLELPPPSIFTNLGTVGIGGGQTFAVAGGALVNSTGGTIQGTGTVNVLGTPTQSLLNQGLMQPGFSPGILAIEGGLEQTGTGALEIEIGGPGPGAGHDALRVSGEARLGGTLRIEALDGAALRPGMTFEVLTYGSRAGAFDAVEGTAINEHLFFDVLVGETSMVLRVDSIHLAVMGLEPTASGFTAIFNRAIDPSTLELWSRGPADVTLVGERVGAVRGSLILAADGVSARFVATGGPLSADTYTVRLRGAADGFRDAAGSPLDGDVDGAPGGDFVAGFEIAATDAVSVSLPDFARGPGQDVDLPATAVGLPLLASDGAGIETLDLVVVFDPALLEVLDVLAGAALPAGSVIRLEALGPGRVRIALELSSPLAAGPAEIARLLARVPEEAPSGAAQVLEIAELAVNGGALAARGDEAVHVVSFLGEVTGNGRYSAFDAKRILRVAVGLDLGFETEPRIDPLILADVTGDGTLSALDAVRVLQEAVGLEPPEIPARSGGRIEARALAAGGGAEIPVPEASAGIPVTEASAEAVEIPAGIVSKIGRARGAVTLRLLLPAVAAGPTRLSVAIDGREASWTIDLGRRRGTAKSPDGAIRLSFRRAQAGENGVVALKVRLVVRGAALEALRARCAEKDRDEEAAAAAAAAVEPPARVVLDGPEGSWFERGVPCGIVPPRRGRHPPMEKLVIRYRLE